MIQAGQAACALEGRVGDSHLACRFATGSRELMLDSKPQSRSDDYLSVARITGFANSDLELVKGSGSVRRRFLDFLGMQSVPGYRKALRDYERTLRSRNALLKESSKQASQFCFLALMVSQNILFFLLLICELCLPLF